MSAHRIDTHGNVSDTCDRYIEMIRAIVSRHRRTHHSRITSATEIREWHEIVPSLRDELQFFHPIYIEPRMSIGEMARNLAATSWVIAEIEAGR